MVWNFLTAPRTKRSIAGENNINAVVILIVKRETNCLNDQKNFDQVDKNVFPWWGDRGDLNFGLPQKYEFCY